MHRRQNQSGLWEKYVRGEGSRQFDHAHPYQRYFEAVDALWDTIEIGQSLTGVLDFVGKERAFFDTEEFRAVMQLSSDSDRKESQIAALNALQRQFDSDQGNAGTTSLTVVGKDTRNKLLFVRFAKQ